METHLKGCSAFITACNPLNEAQQAILGTKPHSGNLDSHFTKHVVLQQSVKAKIDHLLARGVYYGGHAFTIFDKNPFFKVFELMGYTPPPRHSGRIQPPILLR